MQMELGAQGYTIPWTKEVAVTSSKTGLIINSSHNPAGTILRVADIHALADIVRGTNILILLDEVNDL